ncbi:MAG: twin-arginine translocation signal domain-containing protein [Methylobacillus sp.]|nr:twin-arginine translocation signal domain-containing protein [Methylobacillus sp.]
MSKNFSPLLARLGGSSDIFLGRRRFLQTLGALGVGAVAGQFDLGWRPYKARPVVSRQVILDTDITVIGDDCRINEIRALEVQDRKLTGRYFHRYINPGREIDSGAAAIPGLTEEPTFAEIASELCAFIGGAKRVIIYENPFDTTFFNDQFELAGLRPLSEICPVVSVPFWDRNGGGGAGTVSRRWLERCIPA